MQKTHELSYPGQLSLASLHGYVHSVCMHLSVNNFT